MTSVYRIDLEVTAPVRPTEQPSRVERAVTALFPAVELEERHGELRGRGHSIERFEERLREQSIVDTARDHLRANADGDAIAFTLKKQAAYVGVVNFAVGNPSELGDIHVRIRVEEPSVEAFIDGLAATSTDEAS